MTLSTPISEVPQIGPAFVSRLEKLDIHTAGDLLYHLPSRYEDFSLLAKAATLQEGEVVTVQGKILEIKNNFTRGGMILQNAKLEDDTGVINVMWFNQRFLTSAIHQGDTVSLSGKVKKSGNKLQLESPDYEVLTDRPPLHTGRLVPIYPETSGISSKWLRSRLFFLCSQIKTGALLVEDYLDEKTRHQEQLFPLTKALVTVHFPETLEEAQEAKKRLAFDELLISQLESKQRRKNWEQKTVGNKFKIVEIRAQLKTFIDNLPFELTPAQKNVIAEIFRDLAKDTPMNRLLQGDVGSGKTVVAALAMVAAYLNGYQSVLMAPTEILATQHHNTLTKLLGPLNIPLGLATGSKKIDLDKNVLVGTHALLSDKLNFSQLGLVVIDESHRFGVSQRTKLSGKGANPHVLTMTATPIPRTVALTLYGDLDLSILDMLPKNRQPIKTWVVPAEKRASAYHWIENQKTQTFIVCPLIEESESETLESVKSAKKEFDHLSKDIFPHLRLGLLHGKLKTQEKEAVLTKFRTGKLDILVATPVVEVGIDIPRATIMLIEAADRFGLAQLHQLRGRVGRGGEQSYCLLFPQNDTPLALTRLKHLEKIESGLELAEIDLKFRGPGQRYGTAQHGRWNLKIADFEDLALVEKTNHLAQLILSQPEKFPLLHKLLRESKITVAPN